MFKSVRAWLIVAAAGAGIVVLSIGYIVLANRMGWVNATATDLGSRIAADAAIVGVLIVSSGLLIALATAAKQASRDRNPFR